LVLNQFVVWCDVTDRARAKPGKSFECHRRLASMANVRVTSGGEKLFLWLLSLQQQRK
jgi:hypothetical protein